MKNYDSDHSTPLWKYLLRTVLGLLLAFGFSSFWYGIKNSLGFYTFLGILSFVVGIVHIILALKKTRKH